MKFKGHQKSSFIDYPDKICTVLFTGGCNFRCPFCHNSGIVYNNGEDISEEYIFDYLSRRHKMIDAVCISGGEPTIHNELVEFIKKVKSMDYLVKLDTNGTDPKILTMLLEQNLLDYIAMDIKAPLEKYSKVANISVDIDKIKESINIIKSSDIDNEFRTTVCKELLSTGDILSIGEYIRGAKRYTIQNFRDSDTVLDGKGNFTAFKAHELSEIESQLKDYFDVLKIR